MLAVVAHHRGESVYRARGGVRRGGGRGAARDGGRLGGYGYGGDGGEIAGGGVGR